MLGPEVEEMCRMWSGVGCGTFGVWVWVNMVYEQGWRWGKYYVRVCVCVCVCVCAVSYTHLTLPTIDDV